MYARAWRLPDNHDARPPRHMQRWTRSQWQVRLAQATRAHAAAHSAGLTGYVTQPAAQVLAALLHERAEIEVARAAYEELAEQMHEPAGNTFWLAAQLGLALVLRTQGDPACGNLLTQLRANGGCP